MKIGCRGKNGPSVVFLKAQFLAHPLPFIILMFDVDEHIKKSLLGSYANYTRLWNLIHDNTNEQDLQADLKSIYKWAEDNNMEFNGFFLLNISDMEETTNTTTHHQKALQLPLNTQ